MSALQRADRRRRAEGRAALIAYLPVGYPDVDASIAAMVAAVEGGADVVEIGVPYSDPVMDGPVIQQAADVAVRAGVGMRDVLRAVEAVAARRRRPGGHDLLEPDRALRRRPVRPRPRRGRRSGAITPDLIPDEAADWLAASERTGLDRVFLVAPSSTDARLRSTTAACRGFVYAASTMGVTGARDHRRRRRRALVARTRAAAPTRRSASGWASRTATQAAEVAALRRRGDRRLGLRAGAARRRGAAAVRALTADLAAGVRRGGSPP